MTETTETDMQQKKCPIKIIDRCKIQAIIQRVFDCGMCCLVCFLNNRKEGLMKVLSSLSFFDTKKNGSIQKALTYCI